jgi:flagellar basal-body rod modification protein FlgD
MSSPVSGTSATQSQASSQTALGNDQLNMQDFLSLLTTQLENQDPLQPMDDSQFFAQMAQLGQVEGIDELNNSSQVQQAQSLMGQNVVATNTNIGTANQQPTINGVVTSLSIQNGAYYLGIQQADGTMATVPISALQSVSQSQNLSNYSGMVGQTVTGTTTAVNGATSSVTGTVTNVSMANGAPMITIQPKTGSPVTINVNQITSVSS